MAHKHSVYDTDPHFKIDPITRLITTESTEIKLMKRDHGSNVFTFEIPRLVDGHDMSLCDKVRIHFNNIKADKSEKNESAHEVVDLQVHPEDENVVVFTWKLKRDATMHNGVLSFCICFECFAEDGVTVDYEWHTDIYSGVIIKDSIHNDEVIVEQYSDILETWKKELFKIVKDTQPDMAQNDPTQPDYVKNRTHYEETSEEIIIPELTFTPDSGYMYTLYGTLPLVLGETYTVTWDGTDYECVCDSTLFNGMYALVIGNAMIGGIGEDTGEPFIIGMIQEQLASMIAGSDTNEHTVSIKCNKQVVHKLDSKYIETTNTEPIEVLTWDGDYTGLLGFTDCFLVSDIVPSLEDLKKGGSIALVNDSGETIITEFTEEDIDTDGNRINLFAYTNNEHNASTGGVNVVYNNNCENSILFTPKGVLFCSRVREFKINGFTWGNKTTIKEEYLPESVVKNGDTELILSDANGTQYKITIVNGALSVTEVS